MLLVGLAFCLVVYPAIRLVEFWLQPVEQTGVAMTPRTAYVRDVGASGAPILSIERIHIVAC
jgi:hypothetical protein